MKLEHSFEVEAPVAQVWEALIDVERVAPCLPGAQITGREGDAYAGVFTMKLGPVTAAYAGRLELEQVDAAAHRVTMRGDGSDKRGKGSANATIASALTADGATTRVDVTTDLTLTGQLARFSRGGMIEDVSNRLLGEFVTNLQSSIVAPTSAPGEDGPAATAAAAPAPPASEPIRGVRLVLEVLWGRVKRAFARSSRG